MPTISFTQNIQRHVDSPQVEVAGATVREALDSMFATNPRVRGYVLDDQAALRKHIIIFVDGRAIVDRVRLSDSVTGASVIYIFQALSGG